MRTRSPLVYRITLAAPFMALGFLLLTGRWSAYFRAFLPPHELTGHEFAYHFTTALIWIASLAPLLFVSWELGSQYTAARRQGLQVFAGLRDVVRIASSRDLSDRSPATLAAPPRDRPGVALLLGLGVFVLMTGFLLGILADLRTPRGAAWVTGATALMGVLMYAHQRAIACIADEPGVWDPFRQLRLLNPARYQPPGRHFLWLRLGATVALAIWWLVSGVFLAFPH